MESPYRHRREMQPWIWPLIALIAVLLLLVVWWGVAAQSPQPNAPTPDQNQPAMGSEQPMQPSTQQPVQQPPTQVQQPPAQQTQQPATSNQSPTIVKREKPVNIFIERQKPQPKVVVIPQGQQTPEVQQHYSQVRLPDQFRFNGVLWQPSGDTVNGTNTTLQDTGMTVSGLSLYVDQDSQPPYTRMYIETAADSDIYVAYIPTR